MFKNFTLLFVLFFVASTSFAATVTVGGNIALRHDYVSDVNHDGNTTKGDSANEFRTYADIWFNSQINDQLGGLISLKFFDANDNPYEIWGSNTGVQPFVYEAYVNYLPIEGLNIRVGRQAWKMGDGFVIGDYDNIGDFYVSQNGLNLSYEMPELFKANLLVSLEGTEATAGIPDGDKPMKSSKFYALWLNTTAVPFVQNINLFYAARYDSWGDTLADPDEKLDDTLSLMGISLTGTTPVGPAALNYMGDYYMNGGKLKSEDDTKFKGTFMRFGLGATMAHLHNLNFMVTYMTYSGDKGDAADEMKEYIPVHDGALVLTDSANLFQGYGDQFVDNAGLNVINAKIGATPVRDLDLSFEYIMKNAAEKEVMDSEKAGLATEMVLKANYKGLENLDLMFAVGQQKLNKDNVEELDLGKDGQIKTKLVATYKF